MHLRSCELTHTMNTHPEQWAAIYAAAPREQLGVRCLAQGHLSRSIESAVHSLPPPTISAGPRLKLATFGLHWLFMFAFIILQKHNVLLLLWVHTQKHKIVFTDSKDVLLLSVWPKITVYFQSKWAHQRLYLSCSERTTFHTPHRHLNSAHFSWLTLDWVAI